MRKILKRTTKTQNREILPANGGASINAAPTLSARKTKLLNSPLLNSQTPSASSTPPAPRPSPKPKPKLLNSPLLNSKTPLELALKTRLHSQTELTDLNNLLTEKSTRQTTLEKTGNLFDPAVIAEISTLQIFTRILPQRIAAKQADDATAEQTLIQATNDFIHQHLGPRIRKLAAQTREKVETELKPHFRDPRSLSVAVTESQRVRTIEALSCTITEQPPHGAISHAEAALKSWTAADEFEKTLNR